MTKASLAEGWCPKHDRVFASSDGRCPECGTKLVALSDAASEASPEAAGEEILSPPELEPTTVAAVPSRTTWIKRGILAGAVVAAFVLGLVFPRTQPEDRPLGSGKPVSLNVEVNQTISTPAGVVRLRSVNQLGKRIEATFSVFEGFSTPRLLDGASVEVSTVAGGSAARSSFGLGDTKLISDPQGFTITGELEAEDERISTLRITTLAVRVEASPSWDAELGSIWPASAANEPRVLHVGRSQDVGGGRVTLATLLAWSDRLEAVFNFEGLEEGQSHRYEFGGIQLEVARTDASGTRIGGTLQSLGGSVDQRSTTQLVATFTAVPPQARTVTLRAVNLVLFISGPWTWEVPSR